MFPVPRYFPFKSNHKFILETCFTFIERNERNSKFNSFYSKIYTSQFNDRK
jgi:hypothetical protein